jgi:hypothetical protein
MEKFMNWYHMFIWAACENVWNFALTFSDIACAEFKSCSSETRERWTKARMTARPIHSKLRLSHGLKKKSLSVR